MDTPSSHLFERTISTKAFEQYTQLCKTMGKRIMLNSDGILQEIQIRYRGDNPQNWLLKKNLRIKTRKRNA